jgi:hypothetical protein
MFFEAVNNWQNTMKIILLLQSVNSYSTELVNAKTCFQFQH